MIFASIQGRAAADAERRTSKAGRDFVKVNTAVNVESNKNKDAKPMWVSVLSFDADVSIKLNDLVKGDNFGAVGKLSRNRYTGNDGNEREGWTLFCDSVISPYAENGRSSDSPETKQDLTDDEIPF